MHSKKDEFHRKLLRGEYDGSLGAELQQQGVVDEKYLERSFNLASSLQEIQKELSEIFGELPDIITTVGVLPERTFEDKRCCQGGHPLPRAL